MNGPTNGTNNPAPQRTVNIFESADLERILDAWDDEGVWTPEFVTQVKADIFRALTPAQRDEI